MKLEFLWIKEYGKVKGIGINFSTNFSFTYSDKQLSGIKLRDFTSRLYEKYDANITSINAIVGKNGVGKTTILKFLQHNFVSGAGGLHTPCIVCLYDEKTNIHHVYTHEIECSVKTTKEIHFELHNTKPPKVLAPGLSVSISEHIDAFERFTVINYSDFLDLSANEYELSGSFNLSTNYLAQSAPEIYTYGDRTISVDNISSYIKLEVRKQINFYLSEYIDNIPFRKPDYITFSLNNKARLSIHNWIMRIANNEDQLEQSKDYLSSIDELFIDSSTHLVLGMSGSTLNKTYLNLIYVYLDYISSFSNGHDLMKTLSSFVTHIQQENNLYGKTPYEKWCSFYDFLLTNYFGNVLSDLHKLATKINDLFKLGFNIDEYNYTILVDLTQAKNKRYLEELFNVDQSKLLFQVFDFNWPLSNGEKSLLSLYSRFHDVVLRTLGYTNLEIKENIIILLDEAELGLHPEWQRSFINDFLNVISQLFKGKNIQIIMTTHSPFVLSDLTLSQVIFMDFDSEKSRSKIINNPFDEKQSTFAANIHTLLGDSFFMNSGFAGSFVLKHIDDIVNSILHDSIDDIKKDYDYLDWFINQIGEGIIRNKLIQMLESRMRIDLLNTSTKVSELEARIRKMENKE